MDIRTLLDLLVEFARNYPLLAGVIALALVWYAWRSPREFVKFCVLLAILAAALHFLSLFGETVSTGADEKNRMIRKTTEALGD